MLLSVGSGLTLLIHLNVDRVKVSLVSVCTVGQGSLPCAEPLPFFVFLNHVFSSGSLLQGGPDRLSQWPVGGYL